MKLTGRKPKEFSVIVRYSKRLSRKPGSGNGMYGNNSTKVAKASSIGLKMAGEKSNQVNAASQAGKPCPVTPVAEAALMLTIKAAGRKDKDHDKNFIKRQARIYAY